MNISKKLSGSELFFDLEGDINSTTAPELDKEVNGSLNGVTKLVLDFKKVDYISSAGLRVLLVAYKKSEPCFLVKYTSPKVPLPINFVKV